MENVGALLSKSQQSHIDLEFAVISSPSPPMLAQCSVRSLRQKHRGEIGSRRLRSMSSSIRDLHSHRPKLMIEKKQVIKQKKQKSNLFRKYLLSVVTNARDRIRWVDQELLSQSSIVVVAFWERSQMEWLSPHVP